MDENLPTFTCDSLIPRVIDCGICHLRPLVGADIAWLEELFGDVAVSGFIMCDGNHAADLVGGNEAGRAMSMCVEYSCGMAAGYISALPVNDCYPSMPRWKLEFAVSAPHRGIGLATAAVGGLTAYLMRNFSLPRVVVDVCDADRATMRVVEKCGFVRPLSRYAYIDYTNVTHGVHYLWYKLQPGRRAQCFAKGMQYYRLRRFVDAAGLWHEALECNYEESTPYNDGMILANIGMAYSSAGWYVQARRYLRLAAAIADDPGYLWDELRWIAFREGACAIKQ